MKTFSKRICAATVAAAILLAGAFFLLPKGAQNSDAVAAPTNPATTLSGQTAAPDQW